MEWLKRDAGIVPGVPDGTGPHGRGMGPGGGRGDGSGMRNAPAPETASGVGSRGKSDVERVMVHFNITRQQIDNMSDAELSGYISKLPPRGTGRQ